MSTLNVKWKFRRESLFRNKTLSDVKSSRTCLPFFEASLLCYQTSSRAATFSPPFTIGKKDVTKNATHVLDLIKDERSRFKAMTLSEKCIFEVTTSDTEGELCFFTWNLSNGLFRVLHHSRERLIAGLWDASDISSRDTFITILKLISTPQCNEKRGWNARGKPKERKREERESDRERPRGQCCRVIGVYLVGSQNSPTAASPSLGNFLNPRSAIRRALSPMYFADLYFQAEIIADSIAGRIRCILSSSVFFSSLSRLSFSFSLRFFL